MKRATIGGLTWGVYAWLLFAGLLLLAMLAAILLPGLRLRRGTARRLAGLYFKLAGLGPTVLHRDRLPATQCVVVANHASYLDGALLFALLPSRFGFVIKSEMQAVPVAGWFLRRLGHAFVDRHHKGRGARDTRRILRTTTGGSSMAFFPEGTFTEEPGLARFHNGAFVTAARAGLPVVPVVIRGARRVLPAEHWLPRRQRLEVEFLDPLLPPAGIDPMPWLRDSSRQKILERLDEPDLTAANDLHVTPVAPSDGV